MTIYYVLYASLVLGAVFSNAWKKADQSKRIFCSFAFLLIAGLLALRHPSMGIDLAYGSSDGYLGMFRVIGNSKWADVFTRHFMNYEKGYVIFCKLISLFGTDYQVLLIACAVISVAAFSWLICKYSQNCLISFLVWMGLPVFLTNYSSLRQVLAIAITVIAFRYIQEKKLARFLILVLLATAFHQSAILFLVAYPMYHWKVSKKVQYWMVGILPVVYVLRYPLFQILSKLLKGNATPDDNNAIILFALFTVLYVFAVIYSDSSKESTGLCNLFWLACFCQAFGGVYSTAMRVGYYFMVYLIILLPRCLQYMKTKLHDSGSTYVVFWIVIAVAFGAFGLYSIYETYWSMSYPYYFFWQNIM